MPSSREHSPLRKILAGECPRRRWRYLVSLFAVAVSVGFCALSLPTLSEQASGATSTPGPPFGYVSHVVVVMQENHSFDNVLGRFCTEVAAGRIVRPGLDDRCDGATVGYDAAGQVPLAAAPDLVPESVHAVAAQVRDIDGGKMDGFDRTFPCIKSPSDCYNQYDPLSGPCTSGSGSCIPNLSALATTYAVSDRTFELYQSPSWEGHLYLVTANQDGFAGMNPQRWPGGPQPVSIGGGWGCDSGSTTQWIDPTGASVLVPSCVPNGSGSLGPTWQGYKDQTAAYVPTIFDELDAHGLSWKIYGGAGAPATNSTDEFQPGGWQWTICPSFAECLYSGQRNNLVPASQILTDAAGGKLPAFSIVTPTSPNSQHNSFSMATGDNYIGQIVSAVEKSSDWPSTAIFVTYDDCGCFYDHVNPLQFNSQWGVRVPMVIVSPYAVAGYTDSSPTTFAGILHFVEAALNLPALNTTDGSAYDYAHSFCFRPAVSHCTAVGARPVTMTTQRVTPPTAAQLKLQRQAANEDT